ncbi:unnamed protein product, partial [Discosporangium mesarthrocarpum]
MILGRRWSGRRRELDYKRGPSSGERGKSLGEICSVAGLLLATVLVVAPAGVEGFFHPVAVPQQRWGQVPVVGDSRCRLAMTSSQDTTDEEEVGVLQEPPKREEALARIKEWQEEEGDDDMAGVSSALMSDVPEPPFYFQVPGEFEDPLLCTDPDWHLALVTLSWLGFPVEVQETKDSSEVPELLMGGEVYDDPKDLIDMLPERYLLSDLVPTVEGIAEDIRLVRPAWEAYLKADKGYESELKMELHARLVKVDGTLKASKGVFVEGNELSISDLELAVTLYHMLPALGKVKQWSFPEDGGSLNQLQSFAEMMHGMEAFVLVLPKQESIIQRYDKVEEEKKRGSPFGA